MKALLLLSWIAAGGAGYYGWNLYQQSCQQVAADQSALGDAQKTISDLKTQTQELSSKIDMLNSQLDRKAKFAAALQKAISVVTTAPQEEQAAPSATNFPSMLTTLSGKTYENCKLDRAFPDGVSFFYDKGVAKVPFTDLDPAFSATFGYDPIAARQYQKQEALREQQSDIHRDAVLAREYRTQSESVSNNANASSSKGSTPSSSSSSSSTTPTSSLSSISLTSSTSSSDPTNPSNPTSPPTPTKSSSATNPANSSSSKTDTSSANTQSLEQQIQQLQDRITYLQGEEAKLSKDGNNQTDTSDSTQNSKVNYANEIAQDEAKLAELTAQLGQ